MTVPLVIAHRGASGYELENTLAAFRLAAAMGADGVELDVHASADGELFVHHDAALPGRPDQPVRRIPELSAEAIRAVRLGNNEPVPTLAEALVACGARLQVFVEVKSLDPRFDERLFRAMDGGPNPSGYSIHSFDYRVIARLATRRPELPRGVLSSSYSLHPLQGLEETGAATLWQEYPLIDRALVECVHAARFRLVAWTVNRRADMEALIALGVDAICTNYPDVGRGVGATLRQS